LDAELRELYLENFPEMKGRVFGDIRDPAVQALVPDHDILCAGFPCQPFSKSGAQKGTNDETRGTLFHEILAILGKKHAPYVILENVGNFGRHDGGRTWRIVRERLEGLGYEVRGTEHLTPQSRVDWRDVGSFFGTRKRCVLGTAWQEGHGLISPHHFGFPQHRERFFIVAALDGLAEPAFPHVDRTVRTALQGIVTPNSKLSRVDVKETRLTAQQRACIRHWNQLIQALPKKVELPSFPLWGDELFATYPFEKRTPWKTPAKELRKSIEMSKAKDMSREAMLERLPSYAREKTTKFRNWKIRYIRQNRDWWGRIAPMLPRGWASRLKAFPASLRKLEWNAKGGERNLWKYVLQFRPSGLRVKRYVSSPALVAMTSTQIPILGPQKRFITRTEGLRLQGFPKGHKLPASRDAAFQALGNAVHVGVVERLAAHLLAAQRATAWPQRHARSASKARSR
jgi:DNA (cytosine-5)-methyltransferase 1